ncbi:hypothetical protein MN116_008631 [Schistosoma mekongi]|uniref:Subfamily S9B unassigned peptidase (S09 family) n=1 Tax=Schistosoma mekongi TaxID=38744 RepID=A0AAE2D259_SCHME|nr:hypothetical protein MN116_008631 [Schistosoma mekongi]
MTSTYSDIYRKSIDDNHMAESKLLASQEYSNISNNSNNNNNNNSFNSNNGNNDDNKTNDAMKSFKGDKYGMSVGLVKQVDSDDTELMTNAPQKRNWKGILLALLVIMFISSLILTASILTTPKEKKISYGLPFTFSNLVHVNKLLETFHSETVNDSLIYLTKDHDLILMDAITLEETLLLSHIVIQEKVGFMEKFFIAPDLSAAIVAYDMREPTRRCGKSKYDVVRLNSINKKAQPDRRMEIGITDEKIEQPFLDFVKWSPKSDCIAFVIHDNVYLLYNPLDSNRKKIINLTQFLPQGDISYGVSPWLYEEEILHTNEALWWSDTGKYLVIAAFDQTNVSTYEILNYDYAYEFKNRKRKIKYPKAGETSRYNNPVVTLYLYDMKTMNFQTIPRPQPVPQDGLLTMARWMNDDIFIHSWTNRIQTRGWISVFSQSLNQSWVFFKVGYENGWVELLKQISIEPIIDKENSEMLIILPRDYSEKGYRGIAKLKITKSSTEALQLPKWMITPNFDVKDILHYDGIDEIIFTGTGPDPKNAHVYWSSTSKGNITCLTCENVNNTYNFGEVLSNGKYLVQDVKGPGIPKTLLKRIDKNFTDINNFTVTTKIIKYFVTNDALSAFVNSHALPRVEYTKLTLRNGTRNQIDVEAKLYLPPELDPAHITQYPLLLYTYGGPLFQVVTSAFTIDWLTYMSATAKVIVAQVDGRGTAGRGRVYEQSIYKKFGVAEIEDQLDSVKALIRRYHFINESQVGAYGWSYGGFTVSHLLTRPENQWIRCGISVAPVSDFRYYSTAYSERYLGRFIDEPDAYARTVIRNPKNMASKGFLLVHGTADDNVHFINSAKLIKELTASGVDIDLMIYPDDDHFLSKGRNLENLYRKMTIFLLDCYNRTSVKYSMNLSVKEDL